MCMYYNNNLRMSDATTMTEAKIKPILLKWLWYGDISKSCGGIFDLFLDQNGQNIPNSNTYLKMERKFNQKFQYCGHYH